MNCADFIVFVLNVITLIVAIITLICTCVQFNKNMSEQEKAINVSLFDLRMQLLSSLTIEHFSVDHLRAELLFNSGIVSKINEVESYIDQKNHFLSLEQAYRNYDNLINSFGETGAESFIKDLDEYNTSDPYSEEYQEVKRRIAEKRLIDLRLVDEDKYEELSYPSYIEIEEEIDRIHCQYKKSYYDLQRMMRSFIETSIAAEVK